VVSIPPIRSSAAGSQVVGASNEVDFLQIKHLAVHVRSPRSLKMFGDLTIAMAVKQAIDLSNEFWLELADLSDGQRFVDHKGSGSRRPIDAHER